MNSPSVRFGIMGLGGIAEKFVHGLSFAPGLVLKAVGSRSLDKAKEFAVRHHALAAYGSYESLVADPAVDIIYIATPHTLHHENSLLCLENGKAVLCEKPFAINQQQVSGMISKARESKIFLMEAFWTRFNPVVNKVLTLINEGKLGEIRFMRADFGFKGFLDPAGRLFNLNLGGGSLLDVGVYPLFYSLLLLGEPAEVYATAHKGYTGVDENCGILLKYPNGAIAALGSSIVAQTAQTVEIDGTEARITIDGPIYSPSHMRFTRHDGTSYDETLVTEGNGYHYEAIEAARCIQHGLIESPALPHQFSYKLMQLMDKVRKECTIVYPGETTE